MEKGTPNYVGPAMGLAFNPDDGIFVGGGINVIKRRGFRKKPYAWKQTATLSVAIATSSLLFKYNGDFIGVLGRNWNLKTDLALKGFAFAYNYFGEGNATVRPDKDIDYNRILQQVGEIQLSAYRTVGKFGKFGIGPFGRLVEIEETEGRFTAEESFPHPEQVEMTYREVGIQTYLNFQHVNDKINPTRGVKWKNQLTLHQEIGGTENQLGRVSSEFSIYLTPNWRRFQPTLAMRAGIGTNIGAYKFFQAQSVGNLLNLRGFRRNRFAGKTMAYQNLDLRIPLFNMSAYVFKGSGGILGFADQGRVWVDGDTSDIWHRSAGPGIWFNFYGYILLSATYAFSPEENLFTIQGGFLF